MASKKRGSPASPRASARASAAGPKADQKRPPEHGERSGGKPTPPAGSRFLKGERIDPRRIDGSERVADLIDGCFLAYNAARLREACQPFTQKILAADGTAG